MTLASTNAESGSSVPITKCRDWQPRHVAVLHLVPPPVAPVITSVPESEVIVANEFNYRPTATGSRPISWALAQSPPGVTFDSVSGEMSFTAVITGYASVDRFELQRVRGPGLFPEIISTGTFSVGEVITLTMQSTWMTDTLDTLEFKLRVWDHGVGVS